MSPPRWWCRAVRGLPRSHSTRHRRSSAPHRASDPAPEWPGSPQRRTFRTAACCQAASRAMSLAALLHETAHELLGVLLKDVVDLIENRVHVVVQLGLGLGIDRCGLDLFLGLSGFAGVLVLLLGHVASLRCDGPKELCRRHVRLEEMSDHLLGATERLHGGNPLQRVVPRQVEYH